MAYGNFCPRCNNKTDALISGLCQDCFLSKHEIFSMRDLTFPRCVKCGKLTIKGRWVAFSEGALSADIVKKVKLNHDLEKPIVDVEVKEVGPFEFDGLVKVKGFIQDSLLEQEKPIHFFLQKVSCDPCMKLVSNYREAIIQLRASTPEDADAMLELTNSMIENGKDKDSLSGVVKLIKINNGYDLWIGSKSAASKVAKTLARIYKTRIIHSKTLIGEENRGVFKYRYTFCIKKM
ncbi:MAG: NMD3-related protein [archaeon]